MRFARARHVPCNRQNDKKKPNNIKISIIYINHLNGKYIYIAYM